MIRINVFCKNLFFFLRFRKKIFCAKRFRWNWLPWETWKDRGDGSRKGLSAKRLQKFTPNTFCSLHRFYHLKRIPMKSNHTVIQGVHKEYHNFENSLRLSTTQSVLSPTVVKRKLEGFRSLPKEHPLTIVNNAR